MTTQLAFANSKDWCTMTWAAEHLAVSRRTIGRLISDGVLTAYQPRRGARELSPQFTMLHVDQVMALGRARDTLRRPAHA